MHWRRTSDEDAQDTKNSTEVCYGTQVVKMYDVNEIIELLVAIGVDERQEVDN